MTNFEKITASLEALAAFLSSLPCIEGPWDNAFDKAFCEVCIETAIQDDCPDVCPHEECRDNPAWWLALEAAT